MTPNRVNRAHWPTRKIGNTYFCFYFSVHGTKWPRMAPNGAGKVFFRLIQPLPTFWAERIWILRIFMFDIFWIPNFWIFRFPDFQNLARAWVGAGWARLEASGPKNIDCLT